MDLWSGVLRSGLVAVVVLITALPGCLQDPVPVGLSYKVELPGDQEETVKERFHIRVYAAPNERSDDLALVYSTTFEPPLRETEGNLGGTFAKAGAAVAVKVWGDGQDAALDAPLAEGAASAVECPAGTNLFRLTFVHNTVSIGAGC